MSTSLRPTVRGRHFMASSGHYLATMAGVRMLEAGGNAFDAGAAMGLALNVVLCESCNLGGVAPILAYRHDRGEVWQISGLGQYPAGATIEWYDTTHGGNIPAGVPATVTPAALGAWVTALARFGSKSFAEVAAPAIELAGGGFPMHHIMAAASERLANDPNSPSAARDVFAPGGRAIAVGEPLVQTDLARSLELLVEAESRGGPDRQQGLRAVLDRFYRGDLAEQMAAFNQSQGGVLTTDDLAGHQNRVEPALETTYRGHRVFACGPWCQGPVVLQALNILERFDVSAAPHDQGSHLHHVLQAINAAMADRNAYYGDPQFVRVPIEGLLSKAHAAAWSERIGDRAFGEMPTAGDAWSHDPSDGELTTARPAASRAAVPPDTTYLCVIDREGNAMSATPSDGVTSDHSALVPGLGFDASDRGNQGWLDPDHPAAVAPGKRPRLTPNPGFMIWNDGRVMPFGTPGGDVQTQAMTQVLLNLIDFGMQPQEAVEAPRVWSLSFPGSWDPHPYEPGVAVADADVPEAALADLRERGHTVRETYAWDHKGGAVCLCRADVEGRSYEGAADQRRLSYAIGW